MMPADIWPPQSRYRSSRFTRSLLRAAVRMKLMPLYKDPEHRCLFEAVADDPVLRVIPYGPMNSLVCRCRRARLYAG